MSATDELRRLLDERGVEWWTYDGDSETRWRCVGDDRLEWAAFATYNDGTLHLRCSALTADEVVEASLGPSDPRKRGLIPHFWTGDETLHIDLGKLPERIDVTLPDKRGREVYSAKVHRFEPERGECHWQGAVGNGFCEGTLDMDGNQTPFRVATHFLSCGHNVLMYNDGSNNPEPKYCPYCGAKVVDA